MNALREAAQHALEALELAKLNGKAGMYPAEIEEIADAIAALRAALAEPVQEPASFLRERAQLEQEWCELKRLQAQYKQPQEPVAWLHKDAGHFTVSPLVRKSPDWHPLYTHPAPQRQPHEPSRELLEALQIIATPQRPDGTWNRDREACRQLAAEALGFHNKGDWK